MSEAFIVRRGGSTKLFAAISVTYPAGSTCTCTDGVKTLRAKDSSGNWVFAIPSIGTWTVTATDGTNTNSQTVEITAQGQSVSIELMYVPPGALYWRGAKLAEFTAYAVKANSDYTGTIAPTITENAEAKTITFSIDGSGIKSGTVMFSKYDLTNYTQLRAKLENPLQSDRKYMFVSSNANGSNFASSSVASYKFDQTEPGEISLDLSGISGEYYVGFGLAFNSNQAAAKPPVTITISELELL